MNNTQNENWIADFVQAYGRAPRILHVGNINNNAYQVAKLLNAAGADCDVLCADYYYSMANPEWDDADFVGDVGSRDFPAWHKVNLGGFARPAWFAQGPRRLAIAYLLARRRGNAKKAGQLWKKMGRARQYLVFRENSGAKKLLLRLEGFRNSMALGLGYVGSTLRELFTSNRIFRLRLKSRFGHLRNEERQALATLDTVATTRARLQRDAARFFPNRKFAFGTQCDDHIRAAALYAPLFEQYDLVQAYATDPVWPYLAGYPSYVAWEHGTLRDTPYEDSDLSRLTLLAYARAKAVYVTNVDCYDSAVYITKNSHAPIVCGLHGFDTERMLQKQRRAGVTGFDRARYAAPNERLFFCPARIDIDPHYGTYLKKNDLLYRALGRLWRETGGGFRVLQLESGNDVAALQALIHRECPEMEASVTWHAPFQKAEYDQILQNAELVFDNLLLPLMGGNGIETLMSGHAALVNRRIPEALLLRFFPEMWPVLEIEDEGDIYLAAQKALTDPAACTALAQKGQQWILKYHGHAAIVQRHLQAYRHVYPLAPL